MESDSLLGAAEQHVIKVFVENLDKTSKVIGEILEEMEKLKDADWEAVMLDSKDKATLIQLHESIFSKLPERFAQVHLATLMATIMFTKKDQ